MKENLSPFLLSKNSQLSNSPFTQLIKKFPKHLKLKQKFPKPLKKWSLLKFPNPNLFMFRHLLTIRSIGFLGFIGFCIFLFSISMDIEESTDPQTKKNVYSVWALPQEDLKPRLKKLMGDLRSEFGGPEFEPHVTAVGAIRLMESEARDKFAKSCEGLKGYSVKVEKVATGTFFYQCVFLLLHKTPEVVEPSAHCSNHFGYKSSTPYMPHLSLLYADLTEDEKKRAQEKANTLDESISSLTFQITRLALYKTDTEDKTLKSWEKVAECYLPAN